MKIRHDLLTYLHFEVIESQMKTMMRSITKLSTYMQEQRSFSTRRSIMKEQPTYKDHIQMLLDLSEPVFAKEDQHMM